MKQADAHADHGRDDGGQGSAGHSQLQGEHQQIVKQNIENAAGQGGGHGGFGGAVIADKGGKCKVQHEKRGEEQNQPQVGNAHGQNFPVRAQERQNVAGAEQTSEHRRDAEKQAEPDGIGKIMLRILTAGGGFQCVAGGGANADHGAQGENHGIDGKHQIQRRDALGTGCLGDEKGVRQNIAGGAHHGQNVGANIFF